MPAPVFITNDSEITRLEGLYIKERKPPATIKGVFLGTVGIVGECVRGPADKPIKISSEARFEEVFGARDKTADGSGGAILGKIWQALLNKRFGDLVVVRGAPAAATKGTLTMSSAATAAAVAATGSITAVQKAEIVDGETFTISDGTLAKIFEFDVDGGGVAGGHVQVNISADTSAAQVAARMRTAINGSGMTVTAAAPVGATMALTNSATGAIGNVAITDTVADADFVHSGMSGGSDATVQTGIVRLDANGPGSWSSGVSAQVSAADDADATHYNLTLTYLGKSKKLPNLNTQAGQDNTLAVLGDDDGNWITLTKLADGRPVNSGPTPLSAGSDGSIADSDFTAANRGLNLLKSYKGLGVVFIAERSNATLKTALKVAAAASSDRLFLCCPDVSTTSAATAEAEAPTLLPANNRLIYCFNHPMTLDPMTGVKITVDPASWMASVLSQIDVDINPGEEDSKTLLAGISSLTYESLDRGDYIALKSAGIAALEKDEGFSFVSGVTTDGGEIVDRRAEDFLEQSAAGFLKHSVKKKNTVSRRRANVAVLDGWLQGLQDNERVVAKFEVQGDITSDNDRAQNIEKLLMRARLIPHMNEILLEVEVGTTVTITRVAA